MPVPTTSCPLNFGPRRLKAAAFSSTTITSCPLESRSFASADPTRPHPTITYLIGKKRVSGVPQFYPGFRLACGGQYKEAGTGLRNLRVLRGVAQLGRALRSGRRGRTFKSCRPDFPPTIFILSLSKDEPVEGPLFSKFNAAARRVLRIAEQECRNHSHYYVGAEHLLVALLEERDPAIVRALDADGVEVPDVHAQVRRALGTGEDRVWEGILITPRLRRIVALAEQHAGES